MTFEHFDYLDGEIALKQANISKSYPADGGKVLELLVWKSNLTGPHPGMPPCFWRSLHPASDEHPADALRDVRDLLLNGISGDAVILLQDYQRDVRPGEFGHHEMVDKGTYLDISAPLFRDNCNERLSMERSPVGAGYRPNSRWDVNLFRVAEQRETHCTNIRLLRCWDDRKKR